MTDPLTLGAIALVALILVWAVSGGRAPSAPGPIQGPSVRLTARASHPGRALIDHVDELGRDEAGHLIAKRLGLTVADEYADRFGRAFAKPALPAPASPPPNP